MSHFSALSSNVCVVPLFDADFISTHCTPAIKMMDGVLQKFKRFPTKLEVCLVSDVEVAPI